MHGKELLEKAGEEKRSDEFYVPVPEGYKKGKTKFIIVSGSVMSGIGKGIFASSLAMLLKYHGLKVSPIKLDGYLNVDAGTLNPYRHGEVFVLNDGTECDMDLGSYERFLDQNLSKDNYLTAGKLFKGILEKERKGDYLGRDVQFIPHVTGEIKNFMRELAVKSNSDVVVLEIGGTVGDLENAYVIEAIREFIFEEGKENVCYINLVYILEPSHLGEQKSKPAQLGLNRLMSMGIQPDLVICRSVKPIEKKIKEKISVYSNVLTKNIFGLHDRETVFQAPLHLHEEGLDKRVIEMLKLNERIGDNGFEKNIKDWQEFTEKNVHAKKKIKIAIAGKYTGLNDAYASILKALEHAATHRNRKVEVKFIESTDLEEGVKPEEALSNCDGLIIPGGFGKRGAEGKILSAKYARENNLPFLGICLGFQLALIEFARNELNLKEANTTEFEPKCENPIIDFLPEQKKIEGLGGNMRLGRKEVEIKKNSLAFKLYKKELIEERFRHRWEFNPKYLKKFEEKGIAFTGKAPNYEIMQIFELPKNDFFIGVQFHPELTSRPLNPSPLFQGLIDAAIKRKGD